MFELDGIKATKETFLKLSNIAICDISLAQNIELNSEKVFQDLKIFRKFKFQLIWTE